MKAINQKELYTQLQFFIKHRLFRTEDELITLLTQLSSVGYARVVKACEKLLETVSSRNLSTRLQLALMKCAVRRGGVQSELPQRFLAQEYPLLLTQLEAILTDLELYLIPNPDTIEGLGWRLWIDLCRALLKENKGETESRLAFILAELSDELGRLIEVDLSKVLEHGQSIIAQHLKALQRGGKLLMSEALERFDPYTQHLNDQDELHVLMHDRVVTTRWGDCHALEADQAFLYEERIRFGMVRIEPGIFWMANDHGLTYPSVKLRHRVKISQPFFMAQKPVTKALFEKVMDDFLDVPFVSDQSACHVSWLELVRFCNRLSELSGFEPAYQIGRGVSLNLNANGFRFPTEAEYEYAAKADTELTYPGSNSLNKLRQRSFDGGASNSWGLFDLNEVGTWCNDSWDRDAYNTRPELSIDPLVYAPKSEERVYRGGGSYRDPESRVAYRSGLNAARSGGCRLVRSATNTQLTSTPL
jgi:formylglycine-generating enzyme required for sulfatase activity